MKLSLISTILVLSCGILTFCTSASAQTPGITSRGKVVIEQKMMQDYDTFLKQHQKQYGYNKASIETWVDGKTYLVATTKGEYSLFTLGGEPLLTRNNTIQWYKDISVKKTDLCSIFILYGGKRQSFRKEIASDTYGIVTNPNDNVGSYFEVLSIDSEIFVKTASNKSSMSNWPDFCGLYSISHGKIFEQKDRVKHFSYTGKKADTVDSIMFDGNNIGIWHGSRKETCVVTKLDNRSGKHEYHSEFTSPGNQKTIHTGYYLDFVPGYGLLSPNNNIQTANRPECDVPTYTVGLDHPTQSLSLVTTDGHILLDSISDITATGINGVFIYSKIINGESYTGLANFKNRKEDIAPRFSDIYIRRIGDQCLPFVRTTLLSQSEKYDPTKTYTRTFTGRLDRFLEYASPDSILKTASQINIDTLSETDLIALSRGILRKYAVYSNTQQYILRCYEIGVGVFNKEKTDNLIQTYLDRINPKTFSIESRLMLRTIERLRHFDESLADKFTTKNNILLGDLIFTRDSIIPQKKQEYLNRVNAREAEIKDFIREQERQKQAQKTARIKAWADAAKQWSDAYNAKQAEIAAKKRAPSKSGAQTSTAIKEKNSSASSSNSDTSNRKAFLKEQIIDWKHKLQKAEASYQQALDSGGDNWEKKRVIESKRNTVNECLEMIRQYESELNSL